MFIEKPFELNEIVATVLAQICCFNNKLPQGAPTSPIVSNLICTKLDSEIQRFSKEHGLFYTRYADDITFSSNKKEIPKPLVLSYEMGFTKVILGNEIRILIEENGFRINQKKVRLANKSQGQEVTGLIVNQTLNINRKYIRNIEATLHNWEKDEQKTLKEYENKYAKIITLQGKKGIKFMDCLRGKIEFIGSIRGHDDYIYQRLISKFNHLRNKTVEGS